MSNWWDFHFLFYFGRIEKRVASSECVATISLWFVFYSLILVTKPWIKYGVFAYFMHSMSHRMMSFVAPTKVILPFFSGFGKLQKINGKIGKKNQSEATQTKGITEKSERFTQEKVKQFRMRQHKDKTKSANNNRFFGKFFSSSAHFLCSSAWCFLLFIAFQNGKTGNSIATRKPTFESFCLKENDYKKF